MEGEVIRCREGETSIHITALDGIVNVNSLFTLAVFLGLAWNPGTDANLSLTDDPACLAPPAAADQLLTYHVFSFSSFLFSSLLALALKQALRISHHRRAGPTLNHALAALPAVVNKALLRAVIVVCSAGSASGCVFLVLALVKMVQIKLGVLGCGTSWTAGAIVPLLVFVPLGLLLYVAIVAYAFTR